MSRVTVRKSPHFCTESSHFFTDIFIGNLQLLADSEPTGF